MTTNSCVDFETHHFSLENGLRVVSERHEHCRSVSIGLWIQLGSSYEHSLLNGASHFIEHMVFKGTSKRSAEEIATSLERRGGDLNAFTDREYTCFHASVLEEDLETAIEVLSDLVLNPAFSKSDFERERKVLLQELAMLEDAPEERVFDLFAAMVWKAEPLGQPVIGTRRSIAAIKLNQLIRFHQEHYSPERMVLSVAGKFEPSALRMYAERYLSNKRPGQSSLGIRPPSLFRASRKSVVASTEQQHLIVGYDAIGLRSSDRYNALILCVYLGGGMGSRLFQEVREKRAMAYSVDAELMPFSDSGLLTIYAAMEPKSVLSYLKVVRTELESIVESGIPCQELDRVKGQIRGSILLSSEFMDSRQESLGRNQLVFGRYIGLGEVISSIEQVDEVGVMRVANQIFQKKRESVLSMGRRAVSTQSLGVL